jgi:hypothetical protein
LERRRKTDIRWPVVDFKEARKKNIPPIVYAFESKESREVF